MSVDTIRFISEIQRADEIEGYAAKNNRKG